jgi:hypothetical protein
MTFQEDAVRLKNALIDERSGIARCHRQTGSNKLSLQAVDRFVAVQNGIDAVDRALAGGEVVDELGKINADDD